MYCVVSFLRLSSPPSSLYLSLCACLCVCEWVCVSECLCVCLHVTNIQIFGLGLYGEPGERGGGGTGWRSTRNSQCAEEESLGDEDWKRETSHSDDRIHAACVTCVTKCVESTSRQKKADRIVKKATCIYIERENWLLVTFMGWHWRTHVNENNKSLPEVKKQLLTPTHVY